MKRILPLVLLAVASNVFGIAKVADTDKLTFTQEQIAAYERQRFAEVVIKKFKVKRPLAEQVVALAQKYQTPIFKTKDILAIISIESRFKPDAKSPLKKDPARGLMQVRPGVWRIHLADFAELENHVKHGIRILHTYHRQLGDKLATVMAYNIGITAYRKGRENLQYVQNYVHALTHFS
jgi:hypothetical protein